MSENEAVVRCVAGEFAVVEVAAAAPSCGSCTSGQCGNPGGAIRRYEVRNTIDAKPGDRVLLTVPDGAVLKAAALSYLMPLVFVIGGAAAGTAWGGDGLPAVAGAIVGLVAGLALLRLGDVLFARGGEPRLAPRLKRQVNFFDKDARACSSDSSFPLR